MKKGKARVAALEAPGKFAIREFEVPKVGEEDVLLEVEMCTICGSDPPVWKGLYAGTQYPTVMGHELIGRIVEMGAKAQDYYKLKVGDRVVPGGQDGCGTCRVCREGNGRLCQAKKYSHATRCTEFPHFLGGFGEYLYIRGGMHQDRDCSRLILLFSPRSLRARREIHSVAEPQPKHKSPPPTPPPSRGRARVGGISL